MIELRSHVGFDMQAVEFRQQTPVQCQKVHPVMAEIDKGTAHEILFGLRLGMMSCVVNRNDGGDGLPSAQAEEILKSSVPPLAGKSRAMNLIVLDDAGNKGQHTRYRDESPVVQHARPLNNE